MAADKTKHWIFIATWILLNYTYSSVGLPAEAQLDPAVFNPGNYAETKVLNTVDTKDFCGQRVFQHSMLLKPADHLTQSAIGCSEPQDSQKMFEVKDDLTLVDIDVYNTVLNLTNNLTLTLVNCKMANTSIENNSSNGSVTLQFVNTTFRGHATSSYLEEFNYDKATSSSVTIDTGDLTLLYLNSTFLQTKQGIKAASIQKLQIADCTFSNDDTLSPVHEPLSIVVSAATSPVTIFIQNSVFEKNAFSNPVQSVMNLFNAALMIKVDAEKSTQGLPAAVNLDIKGCTFKENERALTIAGRFKRVSLEDCSFIGNKAVHAGAAIQVMIDRESSMFVRNSHFSNNTAGSHTILSNLPDNGHIRVRDEEIHISTKCCNGVFKIIGKGGAIRHQRGALSVVNSTLIDNTALNYGGSVYVDMDANLYLQGTVMENAVHEKSETYDILYSKGNLRIQDSKFHVKATGGSLNSPVIYHDGNPWSADIQDIYFSCPIGHKVVTRNDSSYGVTDVGLRKSHFVDQIQFWCKRCGYGYDGQEFGYYNYSFRFEQFAFYAVRTDGQKPETKYSGFVDHHDISCIRKSPEAYPFYWAYSASANAVFSVWLPICVTIVFLIIVVIVLRRRK